MTAQEVLQKTTQFFKQKGIETARLDSEVILAKALGWRRIDLYTRGEYPLSDRELDICREFVRRRATHEPVAYILGEKEFYSRVFKVNSDVLIPRPETEHMVDEALKHFHDKSEPLRILDLGTGSGCIGLTLLCERPQARLMAIDISAKALACAQLNAEALEVADRCQFVERDAGILSLQEIDNFFQGQVDLVVANPPYLMPGDLDIHPDVKAFEPELALFSEKSGLAHFESWSKVAANLLRVDGIFLCEIGFQQAVPARQILESLAAFGSISVLKDYAGHDRVIKALKEQ